MQLSILERNALHQIDRCGRRLESLPIGRPIQPPDKEKASVAIADVDGR